MSAQAGIEVVLIDRDQEAADKGKGYAAAYFDKGIARRKSTPEKKEAALGMITATPDLEQLKGCDLIIEAVFEDPKVKAEMTQKVEAVIPEDCIFASNTSTLPITELAKASSRQEQFIGIHFFSPVERMLLVEIIKGKQTGDRAVAKALDYVRQIRKTPIVVNDARFFYANRCIIPYGGEANRMVTEGVAPVLIDNAAQMLGFPVGPVQLGDETSIDLATKIMRATKAAMGNAYPASEADDLIVWMEEEGRLGRKAKAGYFEYDEKGKRLGYWKGIHDKYPLAENQPELQEVQDRLMFVQALEAVRALEEGVLMDIREGDVGAILGWGFAPWTGGPLSWLDIIGTPYAVERCDQLEAKFGPRFKCPDLLREMAEKTRPSTVVSAPRHRRRPDRPSNLIGKGRFGALFHVLPGGCDDGSCGVRPHYPSFFLGYYFLINSLGYKKGQPALTNQPSTGGRQTQIPKGPSDETFHTSFHRCFADLRHSGPGCREGRGDRDLCRYRSGEISGQFDHRPAPAGGCCQLSGRPLGDGPDPGAAGLAGGAGALSAIRGLPFRQCHRRRLGRQGECLAAG